MTFDRRSVERLATIGDAAFLGDPENSKSTRQRDGSTEAYRQGALGIRSRLSLMMAQLLVR